MKRLVVIIVLVGAVAAPVAAQARRWPIIGCATATSVEHFHWKYKPRYCQTGGPLGTLTGIAGVAWKHWGGGEAYGTGRLVDGLGFTYPAKITAYKLDRTNNFLGNGTYAAWYQKLHVVAKRQYRGGIYRGPYNVFLNSAPAE